MSRSWKEFEDYRRRMNDKIAAAGNIAVQRFLNLDSAAYRKGALDERTKEMLGLAASMVLRCDDCIRYHMKRCHDEGVNREEFFEIFAVSLVVGGSIVIPHLRRAVEALDELEEARS